MTRIIIELCGAILIACVCLAIGIDYGEKGEQAKRAASKDVAQGEINTRDNTAATITAGTLSYQWAALPPIELRTYEARERVRFVYRDNPLPAVCVRPAGVQAELDAARQRANAAAGQLRAWTDAPASAGAGAR